MYVNKNSRAVLTLRQKYGLIILDGLETFPVTFPQLRVDSFIALN